MMSKLFVGPRLRRLREERGLTQAAMAAKLGISPSYLNQLEHNQRPLSVSVLLSLSGTFGIDPQDFSGEEEARMVAELRDALANLPPAAQPSDSELRALAGDHPGIARAFVALSFRYREAIQRADILISRVQNRDQVPPPELTTPYEAVRDFFYAKQNYIAELETAAEDLAGEEELRPGDVLDALVARLRKRHGAKVVIQRERGPRAARIRHFDRSTGTLALPAHLTTGQQAFQVATQLAFLELSTLLDTLAASPGLEDPGTQGLARIGLAHYFAGALLCPYDRFLESAEELAYDIERLGEAFDVSFETTCHRLSTLQRRDRRGVPFFFVRVDRAGNISKRQSATDFHFSRSGGTCPLWAVYEAFAQPTRTLTQLAQMPDGRVYLWIARRVGHAQVGFGAPTKEFAVAVGCDVQHAHRLVYSRGLDLNDLGTATPIGVGCKVCERTECAQRAFPLLGRPLAIDADSQPFAPYPFRAADRRTPTSR